MKIVIAPDSMKECATAEAVAAAIARGVRRALPGAEVVELPLADGGEGTAAALARATGGRMISCAVSDPLGRPIEACYAMLGDGMTAVVEMAATSGLPLVAAGERDPARSSTRGTGELMVAAMAAGAHRILVGLGGSATNDLGAGMAEALGYRLLDSSGEALGPGGLELHRLAEVDGHGVISKLRHTEIVGLCDVTNPLTGPRGASRVYGPQKGASAQLAQDLDDALGHGAWVIERHFHRHIETLPGAGAAGGLGAGIVSFAHGTLRPGVEAIAEAVGLDAIMRGADLAITAEGQFDGQSLDGKLPLGVARVAAAHGVPTIVLAGHATGEPEALARLGIVAALSIAPGPVSLAEAMAEAEANLERMGETVARIWAAGRKLEDHG